MLEGYKYLDNDCNCEFSDGDTTLEDWPIIISAGYITQTTGAGQPGFTAIMDTVYTDSDGHWSYCINSQDILNATNGQNPEYFSIYEGMLPGYYACAEVVYEQKLYGSTGLQGNTGNPLTGGIYDAIPAGSKFSFFNCPEETTVTVSGCKIEDVDCDGEFTQGVDNYLSGWVIDWDNGWTNGTIVTNDDGCYSVEIPVNADTSQIFLIEQEQSGYTALNPIFDIQNPEPGLDYTANFYNCPDDINPNTITVCKIEDVDCDGQFTQGVDNYLSGWTINWLDDLGEQGSVITEDNGCNTVSFYGSEATFWEEIQNGYSAYQASYL